LEASLKRNPNYSTQRSFGKYARGFYLLGNIKVGGIGVINNTKQNARHGHSQISCNVFVHEIL
jgi:hypothetical protein